MSLNICWPPSRPSPGQRRRRRCRWSRHISRWMQVTPQPASPTANHWSSAGAGFASHVGGSIALSGNKTDSACRSARPPRASLSAGDLPFNPRDRSDAKHNGSAQLARKPPLMHTCNGALLLPLPAIVAVTLPTLRVEATHRPARSTPRNSANFPTSSPTELASGVSLGESGRPSTACIQCRTHRSDKRTSCASGQWQ